MTVQAIMSTDLVTIEPTVKVKEAVRIMHEHRVGNLPVVAQDGGFVGLFGIRQAIRLMLPKAAQIESGLRDLSFMPDELGELYYRLSKVGERPVSDFLEEDDRLLRCKRSTPLPEVLELLHESVNTSLPVLVVDEDSARLIGMVSRSDVLEKLVMKVFAQDAR